MDINNILKKDYIKKTITIFNNAFSIFGSIITIVIIGFNPILIACSFILFDIISILLIKLISDFFISLFKTEDDLHSLKSYMGNYYHRYSDIDYLYDYFIKKIGRKMSKIKDIKKLKNNIENDKKENNDISLNKTLKTQKEIFKEGIKSLESFDYSDTNIPKKKYESVLKNIDKLEKSLERNEHGYVFVDTTFTLFSNEVIHLLKSFTVMGSDIDNENKEKMCNLLDSFNDYLKRTNDKIIYQNQTIIDSSYDVVLKNINKTN